MRNIFLIFVLLILQINSYGQSKKVDLSKVNTISQAEEFIKSHPYSEGALFSVTPSQDLAEVSPNIFSKQLGYTFKVSDKTYKVVGIQPLLSFRVSYIYIDGSKYTKTEIDKIRQEIISKYKSGVPFTDLVKKYNMDSNTTGDTNWFGEGMMVEEFEKAVKVHKKGDIFMVDTPSKNWYHVVLKTHSDTHFKKISILKVKSST